ncbi:MAG: hypothetical protein M3454_10370 [Actinomycetota bacterium]|nr:hypothetical protein [Actinomycetota bacterium]
MALDESTRTPLLLRLDHETARALKTAATRSGQTFNSWASQALAKAAGLEVTTGADDIRSAKFKQDIDRLLKLSREIDDPQRRP